MRDVSLAFGMQCAILIDQHSGSLVSWGRAAGYNQLVGGSVNPPSRHISWDAVDASFLSDGARSMYFTECKKRGWYGYTQNTSRGDTTVYSCHIQRVKPERNVV